MHHVATVVWAAPVVLAGVIHETALLDSPPDERLILPGHIDFLAATETTVAAVRDGEVVLVDASGRRLGRMARSSFQAPVASASVRGATTANADRIFDIYGLSDDERDSSYGDAVLDFEGAPAPRLSLGSSHRGRPAAAAPARITGIDISGQDVWVATSDGLWSSRQIGRPIARGAFDHVAVSAGGATVVVARGARMLVSKDGGRGFVAMDVLPRPVVKLAVAEDAMAAVFVLDGAGITAWPINRDPPRVVFAGNVRNFATCDGALLILANDGIYVASGEGDAEKVAPALPAHHLACASARSFAAAGSGGLFTSTDGGRTWRFDGHAEGSGGIQAVAMNHAGLWLATSSGLLHRPVISKARQGAVIRPVHAGRSISSSILTQRAPDTRPLWASWLPRVTLQVDSTRRRLGAREVRILALATVPLDRATGRDGAVATTRTAALRRKASLAGRWAALPAPGDDAEADALREMTFDLLANSVQQ